MKKLQQQIHYKFKTPDLLTQALTHKSAGRMHNERLEFLGDSILGAVIASELYRRFPKADEGKLSRVKSHLVRAKTLSALGVSLHLSQQITLGAGEIKSGGAQRKALLEDTLEAIFGAVFLDGGFSATRRVILQLYQTLLNDINLNDSLKDPKTQLQEYLQSTQHSLPQYSLIQTTGKDHNAIFTVRAQLLEHKLQTQRQAASIKQAQQACAAVLLTQLKL